MRPDRSVYLSSRLTVGSVILGSDVAGSTRCVGLPCRYFVNSTIERGDLAFSAGFMLFDYHSCCMRGPPLDNPRSATMSKRNRLRRLSAAALAWTQNLHRKAF